MRDGVSPSLCPALPHPCVVPQVGLHRADDASSNTSGLSPRCSCPGLGSSSCSPSCTAQLWTETPTTSLSFWPPSSPSVAAMGSFCAVAWRDGDRDRHGDDAGRCFLAQADRHSLTHCSWDGSWFQLCPPGAQSRLPAWVTMGTVGWGKPTPREVAEDEPPWGMVARATLLLGHHHGAAGVTVMG